ncbi:MAG: ribonuclease HII [Chloroflexota bacterium]|jgi:ribonuclease HII
MSGRLNPSPDLSLEFESAAEFNISFVAGIDEAGRGALAGPVFAAAVILPLTANDLRNILNKVTDSKLLLPATREQLFPIICDIAIAYGIGSATAEIIDANGIMAATRQAMTMAVEQLSPKPKALLIDGRIYLKNFNMPQRGIVHGDRRSLSIAAASILAKVSRDQYMARLDERYPGYGFGRHKGYGTVMHKEALAQNGPCPEHRLSFAPLRLRLT